MFRRIILATIMVALLFACKKEEQQSNSQTTKNSSSQLADTIISNLAYGPAARQVYDLHLPANRDQNTPVILLIHGGAWITGAKEDLNEYLTQLKSTWPNVAIANMNYRLASTRDGIHHNEMMADIASVTKSILDNQSTYQISSNIGVVGASAGGQMAMIYAYKYNANIKCVGNIFGPSNLSDSAWYHTNNPLLGGKVGNIFAEYIGQTWDPEVYKTVSPYWYITSSTQPTITFHGKLDPIVPIQQSRLLHSKLEANSVENEYYEYNAYHSFNATQSRDVTQKLVKFFQKYL